MVLRCAGHRRCHARLCAGPCFLVACVSCRVGCSRASGRRSGSGRDRRADDRIRVARPCTDAQTPAPHVDLEPGARHLSSDPAGDVAHRARRHRSRHGLVGRRALLRPPALGHLARTRSGHAHCRRTILSRRRVSASVRPRERLGNHRRLAGPVAADMAIHQGARLSRHDHPEAVRR